MSDASEAFVVHLPLPPRDCWPNRQRVHWRIRHQAQAWARADAYYRADQRMLGTVAPRWGRCMVTLTFVWPDRRKRDLDGALGACKPYLDALTDVGIWTDDSAIVELRMRAEVDTARAGVLIVVREVTDGVAED